MVSSSMSLNIINCNNPYFEKKKYLSFIILPSLNRTQHSILSISQVKEIDSKGIKGVNQLTPD